MKVQQQQVIVLQQQKINEILANPFPLQYPSSSANSNDKNAVAAAAAAMPKSCADLRYFEQTVNGMYLIMETEKVETVFCDFS